MKNEIEIHRRAITSVWQWSSHLSQSGIYSLNPFDIAQVRPDKITIGVVGKGESVDKVLEWIEGCKNHIDGKLSKTPHPNLFMNFADSIRILALNAK